MFDLFHLNQMMHFSQVKLFSPFIRAINYHDISPAEAEQFEQQLCYFAKHFSPVNYEDLIRFHSNVWAKEKPGLVISFDDGYRSFYEVAAPLLEKYGFVGWFFISPGLIDVPVKEQREEATKHQTIPKKFNYGTPRVFLTWDQVLELDRNHVIGCHTLSHCRLRSAIPEGRLYQEIVTSKHMLEQKLEHKVPAFAWVGGEESSYSRKAADMIRGAGYQVAFLTNNSITRPCTDLHLLNRTNIESNFSMYLIRFQISGFLDLFYTFKRKRVSSLVMNCGLDTT